MANIGNLIEMLRGYSLSRTIMDLFNADSYFFSHSLISHFRDLGRKERKRRKEENINCRYSPVSLSDC